MTGKTDAIADGILPCTSGNRLLAYADSSGAYVLRDGAGKVLQTTRFNEEVRGPVLSPDGTKLVGTVRRPGAPTNIGSVVVAGSPVLSTAVFDVAGRELAVIPGYDDATWTPDGKLIATGPY